ncbi:unnamed protein product [Dovyalis caffra]|uniref:Uncharacterized protein n=1 Tax=Dovyalis caffra TaxID=77055 RepID=A0AAV1RIZ1_9ROSI|nr:unnamed protein product [Dovyalis caffra]
MTSRRGRGRPPKCSYKNTNHPSPVNNLHSTVGYFPQHIARKSRTRTKTIAGKTWPRTSPGDVETLPQWVTEKNYSLPQWITKKQNINPKSIKLSENISRTSSNESSSSSLLESSLVPWMAEIVIPGPIPDLDSLSNEVSFLKDFFADVPVD